MNATGDQMYAAFIGGLLVGSIIQCFWGLWAFREPSEE